MNRAVLIVAASLPATVNGVPATLKATYMELSVS